MEDLPRLPLVEGSPDPERKKSKEKKKKDDKTRPPARMPGDLVQVALEERKQPSAFDEFLKKKPVAEADEASSDEIESDEEESGEAAEKTHAPDEAKPELELKYQSSGEVPLSEAGREEEIRFDHAGVEADEIHERPQMTEDEPDLPSPPELTPDELVPIEAEAELPPEPELGAGRGGNNHDGAGGEVPPPDDPENLNPDPEPLPPLLPLNPVETPRPIWAHPAEAAQPLVVNQAPSPEQLRQHQQEVSAAEQRGSSRGVAGGFFLGLAIEHFRHTRREKKREKQRKKERQLLEQKFGQERSRTQQQLGRQEIKHDELSQRLATTETTLTTNLTEQERLKREVEAAKLAREKLSAQTAAARAEQSDEEPEALPADRRVESSSWHRIEIDSRTGKPVEQPTVEYGQEFQRELSHEARPADLVAANSIGTSLVGSAVDAQQPATTSPDPQTDSTIRSILEPPTAPPPIIASHPTPPRITNDAPLGLWIALVIVVLAIIAALILR